MKNHIGRVFGKLTIIENGYVIGKNSDRMCLCKCMCGNEKYIRLSSMRSNKINSCGCIKKEIMRNKQFVHGMNRTRIRKIWSGIKDRCNNKNTPIYKHYGLRGISYDKKRDTFLGFYEDMGSTYKEGLEIDRINNDGNYCKDNCEWVTHEKNMQHTRRNHMITYNGKTMNLRSWAKEIGKSESTISRRIKAGNPIHIVLSRNNRVY